MKIPYRLPCQNCSATDPVELHLDDDSPKWVCHCGHTNFGFFELDFTVGYKILARSEYEHNSRKDYSMSIIFSAMAFECELSRLFRKWTDIASLRAGSGPISDAEIEAMLRRHKNVKEKIEEVGKLLDRRGIDEFASSSEELREVIVSRFPSLHLGSLAEDFQKTLFWPRNRILHAGYTKYREEDSARCYSIAQLGLGVLREMDHAKRA
ncbi:MAG: hypothetical protein ACE5HL_00955 [Terriglobia bacterium]